MKTFSVMSILLIISSGMFFSCKDEEVAPVVELPPAITEWEGVFATQTQWWGGYYSPLVITSEGKAFIAEHEIQFEFDTTANRLTFDWHNIKDQRAKGNMVFSKKVDGRLEFSGSINPRAKDGPVGYSGDAN